MMRGSRATTISAALICALWATSAKAALFALSASGVITANSTGDATIPVGALWAMELIYDTDAPDLDFELTGSPDPTFGRFTNTGTPPAMVFFHYRAGSYEATIDDPAAFGPFSNIDVTFTSVDAIDINITAPDAFPPLAGGDVFFHADFNGFSSRRIFANDGLPTNPALGAQSFDQSTVTLFTLSPRVTELSSSTLTNLRVTPLPEPSSSALGIPGVLLLVGVARRRARGAALPLRA
jgi:hypothetical protein